MDVWMEFDGGYLDVANDGYFDDRYLDDVR
jgi:hypothetical protein